MEDKKIPMKDYISFLELQIQAEKAMNKDFNRALHLLVNVAKQLNAHYSDYDTFCSENKAMAEFLESLGYSQEQITDIANGGKPKIKTNISAETMKEIERRSKQNAMDDIYSTFPENIGTEDLWESIMNNDEFSHDNLLLCARYEHDSMDTIRDDLEVLFNGYKKHALEAIELVIQTSKIVQDSPLKVKRIFEVTTSDLSEDTLELLYYQRADFTPVNYERDGHFFHKSNVEDFLDLESYDEKPSDQTFGELKKLFDEMVQTKSCVLYLRNTNEERNDVL